MRQENRTGWMALGLAVLALWASGVSAAAKLDRPVRLVLQDAAEGGGPVVLDLAVQDGRLDPNLWAAAWQYNHTLHPGTVSASPADGNGLRLSVRLDIKPDPIAPGGSARYEIDLVERREAAPTDGGKPAPPFVGSFTGTFLDRPVKGAAFGHPVRPMVAPVAGHKPLRPGEHPRLIFRKDDLPDLRKRMETPEGQAIATMLLRRSPLRQPAQVTDRHTSWMAANWGAIWQLTADKDAPRKAREILMSEVIAKPMPGDRKDIHHAARLLGVALTYDLCFDAWDDPFRRLVADYLHVAAADLADGMYEGFAMNAEAYNPAPWGHRNAIRMACAGLAAIAILGDAGADARPLGDADRLARAAEYHVATYLRTGVTGAGRGIEAALYKDLALAGGVLQFLHASRVARGRDLSPANAMLLAGNVLTAHATGEGAPDFGLASISIQASGLWPMGLGSAPRAMLPALRWCFDRDVGLAGKRHFGLAYPYQAAYALAGYPFDVPARPPGEALPLSVDDAEQGHFILRDRWQDANDILVETYLNLQSMPVIPAGRDTPAAGGRGRDADLSAGVLNVSGLGGDWLCGFAGPRRLNDAAAAGLLYSRVEGGQARVGMDLTGCYASAPERARGARVAPAPLPALPRGVPTVAEIRGFLSATRPAGGPPPPKPPGPPRTGVKMLRHIAVDLSGACGSPLLVAVVDRCEGLSGAWRLPLSAKPTDVGPGRFVVAGGAGASLAGWVIAPAGARLSGSQLPAAEEYFVVMTIQQGAASAARVDGAGLGAKVTIGGRTVAFDGQRIVLGK